jgi:hypothetical protein
MQGRTNTANDPNRLLIASQLLKAARLEASTMAH